MAASGCAAATDCSQCGSWPGSADLVSGDEEPGCQSGQEQTPKRVAIVGLPNVGKSMVYAGLSGKFAFSANYPRTTTELQRARVNLRGVPYELIDTPGTSGFEHCSEDELPTRDMLAADTPDVAIQCVDASNLKRSLVLTAQLVDLRIPLVICLNMVDEAMDQGIWIDAPALSEALGVPVIPVCAADRRGLPELVAALARARLPTPVRYPEWLENKLGESATPESRARRVEQVLARVHEDAMPGQSVWHMVLEAHHHWAQELASTVVHRTGLERRPSGWDRLADLALHPIGGWLVLALTTCGLYLLVAKVGVGILADLMDRYLAIPVIDTLAAWLGPGAASHILVGDFGLLSLGLLNAMCTVLPILAVFYLAFGFLEDVGYFPLLSVQFDRILRRVGLSGRAVLPMTLGFGCNTVATMATRSLHSPRQRLIACFIISLGIPCAVQLGVMVAILATVPVVVILGLLLSVLAVQVVTASLLARIMPEREEDAFLVEIPRLRAPRWSNIVSRTSYRLREFFLEASPMFVASAALLLLLEVTGLLEQIRNLFAPIVEHALGLPRECADMLLMTLARREVGAVMMKDMVDAGALDLRQIFVGLLVLTLFVPCMSNTLVLGRAVGWRRTGAIFLSVIAIALTCGAVANGLWS